MKKVVKTLIAFFPFPLKLFFTGLLINALRALVSMFVVNLDYGESEHNNKPKLNSTQMEIDFANLLVVFLEPQLKLRMK